MATFVGIVSALAAVWSLASPILKIFGVSVPKEAEVAIPTIAKAVAQAEELIPVGGGAIKKTAVTGFVGTIATGMQQISTGEQAKNWALVTPEVIDKAVEAIVTGANKISKAVGGGTIIDDAQAQRTAMGVL